MPRLQIHNSHAELLEEWEDVEEAELQAIHHKQLHRPRNFRNEVQEQRVENRRKDHRHIRASEADRYSLEG
jgi:hypothetical protein